MTDIDITGSPKARDYFEDIVREMLFLFPITRAEAVGRLNRFWAGQDFSDDLDLNLLRHEIPIHWAKSIYYGPSAAWWKGEEGLEPQPYP